MSNEPRLVIPPTLGRKVYFVPGISDEEVTPSSNGCCDATVVDVHGNGGSVNLVILDAVGNLHIRLSVPFIQDGEKMEEGIAHAHWMP